MSQQGVDTVRRAITAFFSDPPDVETLHKVFDPDCVITTAWGADTTEQHGVQGYLATLTDMSAIWESWEQEVERVLHAGDRGVAVLLRFRAKGRESTVPVESPWAAVFTLRNGRIATSRAFLTHDEALKAVGMDV